MTGISNILSFKVSDKSIILAASVSSKLTNSPVSAKA